MTRRLRPRNLWPWLAAAAALHGLLSLLLGERTGPSLATHTHPAERAVDRFEVELLNDPSVSQATSSVSANPRPTPVFPDAVVAPQTAPPRKTVRHPTALDEKREPGSAASGTPTHFTRTNTSPSTASGEHTATNEQNKPVPLEPNTLPRDPENKPALSLADMGIGTPHAAALAPYLNVNPTALAQNRLDQNLAQAVLDRDRDRSNGIEGPITQALHLAAMAVVVPTSWSKIAIIVGGNGKLADVQIISTNQDARALAHLSTRLKTLLANQTIRVPNGRPVEFTYEIKSAVQLPSGRAPGLGVEVLGIPLKEGRADNSTKVSILTPKVKFEPLMEPDPERNGKVTQTPPQLVVGISVLGIDGDLVDLGSNERQVIHTRLIRQRVL